MVHYYRADDSEAEPEGEPRSARWKKTEIPLSDWDDEPTNVDDSLLAILRAEYALTEGEVAGAVDEFSEVTEVSGGSAQRTDASTVPTSSFRVPRPKSNR